MAYPEEPGTADRHDVYLGNDEIGELLRAMMQSNGRVQRLDLKDRTVWIKRQGSKTLPPLVAMQGFFAALFRVPILKPSPQLSPEAMQAREIARIGAFADAEFPVPKIVYASQTAMVMSDVGPTIDRRMRLLRRSDPVAHDALLIEVAEALGRVHAAGLSHGRPHVRDFFLQDGKVGFMDFEEDPASVMPLALAQARDVLLYFLVVTSRALSPETTCPAALNAWLIHAPEAARVELVKLTALIGRILPLARLIGRVHMGSDLRRFIMATEFLMRVPPVKAEGPGTAKAG
ncbi:serine/threonine protein phosphatase [Rhizobium sp. Root274]|uniref:lipopolysaccharide kinase InaA family protein n=1 Tax=unclassified Rhizobium TaxID=2613769 RepID=UPI000715CF76|nr:MULTISPECIES: lipopolysaccharide kinase InaA family protein [unclassified Rhizobium]KQW32023.1 serine/threonine protein phosphatase [Rhizobium sp. Root1240]KRD33560.1 serine/threonine protein phosphatase [Rhizobium sp. Root274]